MSRELTRPLPRTWWLSRAPYFWFMVRELTSLVVFAYTLLLIWALMAAGDQSAFTGFYEFLDSALSVWLHVVALALGLYHTGTWIALTPKVMVLWRDDERVDPDFVAGMNGVLFLLITGGVLWLTLG
jgi:fumarate reductase subunit C